MQLRSCGRSSTIGPSSPRAYVRAIGRRTLMIAKRVLVANRVRRPPAEGFSWIDRRFLRDYAERLTRRCGRVVLLSGRRQRPAGAVVLQRRLPGGPLADARGGHCRGTRGSAGPRPGGSPASVDAGPFLAACARGARRSPGAGGTGPHPATKGVEPMKVSQWAEIRRLAEVEGLSQRQIAERLRCCWRTVKKCSPCRSRRMKRGGRAAAAFSTLTNRRSMR